MTFLFIHPAPGGTVMSSPEAVDRQEILLEEAARDSALELILQLKLVQKFEEAERNPACVTASQRKTSALKIFENELCRRMSDHPGWRSTFLPEMFLPNRLPVGALDEMD